MCLVSYKAKIHRKASPSLCPQFETNLMSNRNVIEHGLYPGGGVMTLHDYGYLLPEFLKSFGVKFSNIHPASESDFFQGLFRGIYCYANFFCYANFSIVFKPIFLGGGANSRGKLLEGKDSSQWNNVSKHRNGLFSMETLTNYCTVCHIRTLNMLKTSKL